MLRQEDIRNLNDAADMVDAVADKLDIRQEVCVACKLTKYTNWPEFQAFKELAAAADRVRKWADELAGKNKKKAKVQKKS